MFNPATPEFHDPAEGERFAAILEGFPAYIAYVDADLVYRFANSGYRDLLSRDADTILGRTVAEVLGAAAYAVAEPRLRAALQGEACFYEAEFRFPGAPPRWLAVTYLPGRDADGAVSGVYVFAVDISLRKHAEDRLAASDARYHDLHARVPVGICTYDREDRIVAVNGRAARDLDLPGDVLVGQAPADHLDPEAAAARCERLHRVAVLGEVVEHLEEVRTAAGRRWFMATYAPLRGETGRVEGVQVVASDITALKRAEEEARRLEANLRHVQKMQAIGTLAGGVAHDFNNILQTVLGYAEEIRAAVPPGAAVRADLAVIEDACRRGAALTGQLLAFGRQQLMKQEVVALDTVVASVLKMIRRLIGEDIELSHEPGAAAATVFADEGHLSQVLLNLAVNARDAMEGGGVLTVTTGTRVIAAADCRDLAGLVPGDYAWVSVRDTGPGIAPDLRERIFEPFFTTKAPGRGTGLGLAMVFGIVKQHGGTVEVRSEPGRGAEFIVLLPRHAGPAAVAAPASAPLAAGAGGTIILAEDDDAVRRVMARTLAGAGYRVLAAADGFEALALHREHRGAVDLLVLDVVMPGCDGCTAWQRMKEEDPGLAVLFVSGYPLTSNLPRVGWDPSLPLLRKPFSAGELLAAVRGVLDPRAQRA